MAETETFVDPLENYDPKEYSQPLERALAIDPHDTELRELRLRALLNQGAP